MATGVASSQAIYVDGGRSMTLSDLYREYIRGRLSRHTIHFVDPNNPKDVLDYRVDTIITEKIRMAVRLIDEEGASAIVSAAGYIIDAAEDYPERMTLRLPSDAKCHVGPNGFGSGKLLVRKIVSREYVTATIMTLPMPNVITTSNYIVVC